MVEDFVTYYARRAAEELSAAERATDVNARKAHTDLAARYAAMANEENPSTPGSRVVPTD